MATVDKQPEFNWEYRLVRKINGQLGLHDVCFLEDRIYKIEQPFTIRGDVEKIKTRVLCMLAAISLPIIELKDIPDGVYNPR